MSGQQTMTIAVSVAWSRLTTYDDHGIPHFHAVSSNFDFKFAIADSAVISGTGHIRGRDLAAIHAWVQKHKDRLYLNWNLAREGKPLQDIED
jgi:hypothetical protein